MGTGVLLVEDDPSMREVVALGLERHGFLVVAEADGAQALKRFLKAEEAGDPFDIVLLDIMLPSMSGVELCRDIRSRSRVPIVMITARTKPTDAVAGFEVGADDYIRKPFDIPELLARVEAVLRRTAEPPPGSRVSLGDLEIDPQGFRVQKGGRDLPLTATEFRLLFELAHRPGQVFTREVLLHRVWDHEYLGDSRMVDMAIKRLREKIEDDPAHPRLIRTVRGVGYALGAPES